jgi:ADP-heptose:LPS heptosyltransferase
MSPFLQKIYAAAVARYFDCLRVLHRRPLLLFFRDGGIGDILCTFPAAAALADQNPEVLKVYCTNPAFVDLPRTLRRFDRVLGIKCNDLVAAAARRHRVVRFRYPDEEPPGFSQHYLADEFAQGCGLPAGLPWPKLDLGAPSPRVQALFDASPLPAVCIHTGPTWAVREWPAAAWAELVAKLKSHYGCRVLEIGARRHFREGGREDPAVPGVEDCRDRFTLLETLQIIGRSRLLLGIDSGMIHGAVALGIPAVGVFGPTSAALRLPSRKAVGVAAEVPCLGCHHRHPRLHWQSGCEHDIRCMKTLSVERVFTEALHLW